MCFVFIEQWVRLKHLNSIITTYIWPYSLYFYCIWDTFHVSAHVDRLVFRLSEQCNSASQMQHSSGAAFRKQMLSLYFPHAGCATHQITEKYTKKKEMKQEPKVLWFIKQNTNYTFCNQKAESCHAHQTQHIQVVCHSSSHSSLGLGLFLVLATRKIHLKYITVL